MAYRLGRYLEVESIAVGKALDDLKTMVRLDAALEQPEAVVEPHIARRVRGITSKSLVLGFYMKQEPCVRRAATPWLGGRIIEHIQDTGPGLTTEECSKRSKERFWRD